MKNLLLAVAISASTATHAFGQGTPKISFDKTVYDFGKTSGVESVAGKFLYTNSGSGMLKVDKPTVTCGCTVAEMKPDTLQPGETGELSFTLELGTARAKLVKHITVTSNDPETPKIDLTIKADYVPLYEVVPLSLRFDVRQGEATNLTVRFSRTDGNDLKIARIEASQPWITSRTEMLDARTARLSLDIRPDGGPRRVVGSLQIFTDGATNPASSIFLSGRVVGDIVVTPEVLHWNLASKESFENRGGQRRLVVSSSRPGQNLQVRHATSSVNEIDLKIERDENGYALVASLREIPKSSVRGTITIDATAPSEQRIEIPVTVTVFRGGAAQNNR